MIPLGPFLALAAPPVAPPPVYATWDTTLAGGRTYSGGDLIASGIEANKAVRGTLPLSSGKHLFEFLITNGGFNSIIGIAEDGFDGAEYPGSSAANADSIGYYAAGGQFFRRPPGDSIAGQGAYDQNDVMQIYVDLDAGNIGFYEDGVATPAGIIAIPGWAAASSWRIAAGMDGGSHSITLNTGAAGLSATGIALAASLGARAGWYTGG